MLLNWKKKCLFTISNAKKHIISIQSPHEFGNFVTGLVNVNELAETLNEEGDNLSSPSIVELALEQLSRRNLLKESVDFPSKTQRLSRRNALKKIATVASLPAIMTVMAQPAFALSSRQIECCRDSECAFRNNRCASFGCDSTIGYLSFPYRLYQMAVP